MKILAISDIHGKKNPKLTKQDNVFDTGKIYFGKYTFFIIDAPVKTDSIEMLVASQKNANTNWPANK